MEGAVPADDQEEARPTLSTGATDLAVSLTESRGHLHCLAGSGISLSPLDANPFASATEYPLTLRSPSPMARLRSAIKVAKLPGVAVVVDGGVQCETDRDYLAIVPEVLAYDATTVVIGPGTLVLFQRGWSNRWPRALDYIANPRPVRTDSLHMQQIDRSGATPA